MLKESVHREEYPSGAPIFREGEPGTCAYVVERGAVEISSLCQGRKVFVARLGEGDLFGEMALIDGEVRTGTAIALEETVLVVIDLDHLREKFEVADPLLGFFVKNVLERFRLFQSQILGDGDEGLDAAPAGVPLINADMSLTRHRERAMRKIKFEDQIHKALGNGEFELHFQPILDLRGGRMSGVEALLRWNHPERGLLYPKDFIGFAEETGLIIPMGLQVFEKSCRALKLFQSRIDEFDSAQTPFFVSVNLSSRQFADIDLVRNISNIIDQTEVNPGQIKLEITESLLMDNPARAAVTLNGVKALGLEIAIDDFGTGYSSLSYLHRFHMDSLKIDRSFVSTATMNAGSMEVVRAIAGLAHNLGLEIIGEGIEQPDQVTLLRDLQCEYGQGHFFSRPVAASAIIARLEGQYAGAKPDNVAVLGTGPMRLS